MPIPLITSIANSMGGSITDGVAKIIQCFKVDPTVALQKQAEITEIQLKMQSDAAAAVNAQIQGQLEINKVEAASNSKFVAGWRPFIGWVCGSGLAYGLILQPFCVFLLVAFHSNFDATKLPQLDRYTIMGLLTTMLGMGAMRSYDKAQGTDNGH